MAGYGGNFQYEGSRALNPVGFEAYPPPAPPAQAPGSNYPMTESMYPRVNDNPPNSGPSYPFHPSASATVTPLAADDPANLPPVGFEGVHETPATPSDVGFKDSHHEKDVSSL